MKGYYVTDVDCIAVLDDTIFLDYNDVVRMREYYSVRGIRANIKTLIVRGTQLGLGMIIDSDTYKKDPEGMDKYLKQSMISEFAKKLDIRFERAPELDIHIGSHVDYHFRGSIELPTEYIKK